jgi:hypothetical protein
MEAVQTANPPSFESVWAALQETDRIMKENAEQHEREMKELRESHKGTDQILEETRQILKESAREMKESKAEFNERLGNYIKLFGDFTEYTMAPKLRDKFMEFGLDFPKANRNSSVKDNKTKKILLETDVMLENGDKAMMVEIKTQLTVERVNKHIERLEKMRKYADSHGDKRTFLGAVAGVVVDDEVREYALNQGLYLIEPEGENLIITPPQGKPKEW